MRWWLLLLLLLLRKREWRAASRMRRRIPTRGRRPVRRRRGRRALALHPLTLFTVPLHALALHPIAVPITLLALPVERDVLQANALRGRHAPFACALNAHRDRHRLRRGPDARADRSVALPVPVALLSVSIVPLPLLALAAVHLHIVVENRHQRLSLCRLRRDGPTSWWGWSCRSRCLCGQRTAHARASWVFALLEVISLALARVPHVARIALAHVPRVPYLSRVPLVSRIPRIAHLAGVSCVPYISHIAGVPDIPNVADIPNITHLYVLVSLPFTRGATRSTRHTRRRDRLRMGQVYLRRRWVCAVADSCRHRWRALVWMCVGVVCGQRCVSAGFDVQGQARGTGDPDERGGLMWRRCRVPSTHIICTKPVRLAHKRGG